MDEKTGRPRPLDAACTETRTRTGSGGLDARVPGLTVLYHPDLGRVGDRAVLNELTGGGEASLSRLTPDFSPPGATAVSRPLGEPCLSRTPITLRGEDGRFVIDLGTSRTRLEIEGREVSSTVRFAESELENGAILVLGSRIVLLLHFLAPTIDPSMPRYDLIGESPALVRLRRELAQTVDLDVPILLRGEPGTGKEDVARAIHDAGPRCDEPWLAFNMGASPPGIAAVELFGAGNPGAGSDHRRAGLFLRAHGGTLFLDEIDETPPEIQALLLRALETGELLTAGGEPSVRVDVRVISATDADLDTAIESERFSGPLLQRLSGHVIRVPPLRERREDFGRLFAFFLLQELAELGMLHVLAPRPRPWLPASLVARLAAWHWPGNVRQLAHAVHQLVTANHNVDPAMRFGEVESLLAQPGPEPSLPPTDPAPPPPGPSGPRRRD